VTSGGAGSVQVIDTATNTIVKEIAVGKRPWNMALTPDGSKLYVACGPMAAIAGTRRLTACATQRSAIAHRSNDPAA
jgi:YVTN family beta-propeller protein